MKLCHITHKLSHTEQPEQTRKWNADAVWELGHFIQTNNICRLLCVDYIKAATLYYDGLTYPWQKRNNQLNMRKHGVKCAPLHPGNTWIRRFEARKDGSWVRLQQDARRARAARRSLNLYHISLISARSDALTALKYRSKQRVSSKQGGNSKKTVTVQNVT